MSAPLTIGFGIISWRSPKTLRATLEAHIEANLTAAFDESLIYFQDPSEADTALAKEFGIPFEGGANAGIAEGMRRVAQNLSTDLVLLLENDCPVVESFHQIGRQIEELRERFGRGELDLARLRHRFRVGAGLSLTKYFRYYPVHELHPEFDQHRQLSAVAPRWISIARRWMRPKKAQALKGRSIYVEKRPDHVFPGAIRHLSGEVGDALYLTDSRYLNWTNQSVLLPKAFFLETLMPYVDAHPCNRTSNGFQSPEKVLNTRWWREQRYRIGVGRGLFTHQRVDGSWRPNRPSYEPT